MKRRTIGLFSVIALLAFGPPANAILVNLSIQGTVTGADAGNPFGLSAGDTVSADAMFDDELIAETGLSTITFGETGNAFGNMLTLTLGNIILQETNDIDYGLSAPALEFNDGILININYITFIGFNDANVTFTSGSNFSGDGGLTGSWNFESTSITPKVVPLPAAFWLFGSGLIGLFGLRHRSRQTTAIA